MADECVVVFYGLRWSLGLAEEINESALASYEDGSEPRLESATKAKLSYRVGLGDSDQYYLVIGAELGVFGPEDEQDLSITDTDFDKLRTQTKAALKQAGFTETPGLQVQLELEPVGGSKSEE